MGNQTGGNMFSVTFEFSIGDRVTTPWGDMGLVNVCAVMRGNAIYYSVQTKEKEDWIAADDLKPWENKLDAI